MTIYIYMYKFIEATNWYVGLFNQMKPPNAGYVAEKEAYIRKLASCWKEEKNWRFRVLVRKEKKNRGSKSYFCQTIFFSIFEKEVKEKQKQNKKFSSFYISSLFQKLTNRV